jgi:hypothetical protein
LAFLVRGEAMNDLRPHPLVEGDRIVGLDYRDVQDRIELRDGMLVVVERTRDGGDTREWSARQVAATGDRIEFRSRSTNPRHRMFDHERSALGTRRDDDGCQVRILAIIRRVVSDFDVRRGITS